MYNQTSIIKTKQPLWILHDLDKKGVRSFHQKSVVVVPHIREQMSGPDLHVFTLKFVAPKKLGFPKFF